MNIKRDKNDFRNLLPDLSLSPKALSAAGYLLRMWAAAGRHKIMSTQKTLFDAGPTAKTGDPYSSYLVGDTMQRSGMSKTQRLRVLECLRHHGPSTGAELGRLLSGDRYAAHRRLSELERMCLAERFGFRRCNVTGRKCQVWKAVKPETTLFGRKISGGAWNEWRFNSQFGSFKPKNWLLFYGLHRADPWSGFTFG